MPRLRVLYIAGALVFATLVLWTTLQLGSFDTIRGPATPQHRTSTEPPLTTFKKKEPRLHFLVVATSSGLDLCRLLLSASILSYPPPILIDWAGEGQYDAAASHLAKVAGPIRYFENLGPLDDTDIVLLVDGFDVTFQLGPDVLLKRYFQETAAAQDRLIERFGRSHVEKHNLYNSILFGPDKVCWPDNFRRAACWAVPGSPLPPDAFGPYTDQSMGDMPHARPRWLNSGTIMGPVSEMREMFLATQRKINETYNPEYVLRNSDQMYFADLWADQEYARTLDFGGKPEVPIPGDVEESDKPVIDEGKKVEWHMGLDYKSALFQTAAGYRNYVSWMTMNRPSLPSVLKTLEPYRMELDEDVLSARKPYADIRDDAALRNTSWRDVSLGVNIASGLAFPILHFTGDKSFRDTWWSRSWFFDEAERLRRASTQHYDEKIGLGPINGVQWAKNTPYDASRREDKAGPWTDTGDVLSWDHLCADHETLLYKKPENWSIVEKMLHKFG